MPSSCKYFDLLVLRTYTPLVHLLSLSLAAPFLYFISSSSTWLLGVRILYKVLCLSCVILPSAYYWCHGFSVCPCICDLHIYFSSHTCPPLSPRSIHPSVYLTPYLDDVTKDSQTQQVWDRTHEHPSKVRLVLFQGPSLSLPPSNNPWHFPLLLPPCQIHFITKSWRFLLAKCFSYSSTCLPQQTLPFCKLSGLPYPVVRISCFIFIFIAK